MEFDKVLKKRRSIRRFKQIPVEDEKLSEMLEAARFAPSGSNTQKFRYYVVRDKNVVKEIFKHTKWAAQVAPHRNPVLGLSAPPVFIAVSVPRKTIPYADAGAAIQNLMLKAADIGLGTCWLGSFNPDKTAEALKLEPEEKILFLVAVGYPDESPVCEDIPEGHPTKYYLDKKNVIHVPKLTIDAITKWI